MDSGWPSYLIVVLKDEVSVSERARSQIAALGVSLSIAAAL